MNAALVVSVLEAVTLAQSPEKKAAILTLVG